jgi:phosphoglycolate phosphatase-like HAD superfamily hydrolase
VTTLVSFDIDGTLEVGDPPGIITVEMVRSLARPGYVIGSCSDRPISYQERLWERLAIVPDFTVLKHRLADVKARFAADTYVHVGDTDVDDHFATAAGFQFLRADARAHESWHRIVLQSRCRHPGLHG